MHSKSTVFRGARLYFDRSQNEESKGYLWSMQTKEGNMLTYSNPRMSATIENWPSGSKRVTAVFEIEQHPKRGERATRKTTGAVKKLTFARKARIVDGSDGRTYIAELSMYGFVSIMNGDMKYQAECIHERDERYPAVMALFT